MERPLEAPMLGDLLGDPGLFPPLTDLGVGDLPLTFFGGFGCFGFLPYDFEPLLASLAFYLSFLAASLSFLAAALSLLAETISLL